MPNYRFNGVKKDFYKFLDRNKKIGEEAVLKFYREAGGRLTFFPSLSTLYKWYNDR